MQVHVKEQVVISRVTTSYFEGCYSNQFVIVAFLENATIGYSLESLYVCVCVSVCVCVCFCTITQKEIDLGTLNRNTV